MDAERSSYWGHANECAACFVGARHTKEECRQMRAAAKASALDRLRDQVTKRESMGVIDMYERAAWDAGATAAETDAVLREGR